MAVHRDYVAMLRRRQFFERRDERWQEMLPYRSYGEFWKLVAGRTDPALHRDKLLMGINRGEGLRDPRRLGDVLALRVRVVDRGTVQSYRLFPGDALSPRAPDGIRTSVRRARAPGVAARARVAGRSSRPN